MEFITTYQDLIDHSKRWNPSMTKVSDPLDAADHINFPHEDYPLLVNDTKETIDMVVGYLQDGGVINENMVRMIHKMVMKSKDYLRLGEYRMGEVIVGERFTPPQPYLIPSFMMSIFPVGTEYQKTEDDLMEWFRVFETIHPFEDGNGRVGGIVLASMSYVLFGYYIVNEKFD